MSIWISEEAIAKWKQTTPSGRRGHPKFYSDLAIETVLTLRSLFRLPLRQSQGLFESLAAMMNLNLVVPNYSTLSRRASSLGINLNLPSSGKPIELVIDATGLKIFGEGEWKVRTHGKSKRRTWRKLHVGIDRQTLEIVALELTHSNVADCTRTKALLDQCGLVKSVRADKGYDNCRALTPIAEKGAKAIIPPRSGAALKTKNLSWGDVERNRLIMENRFIGKKIWKTASGYSQRSLVENAIGRYKNILGPKMHARSFDRQKSEVRLGAQILNKMTRLGMPESYKL